ncbi:MAG TPA: hypothetical protein DCM00_15895, partial [Alcanivorax sp.]|nr:hypothetical protein [Alcanivorax sp.]
PEILYRDGLILVVNKPAGINVHAGPSGGPSLEDTFDALRFGLPKPPALAHRLDRDTSGCLVLGRHAKALRRLGALFSEGRAKKTYWAVVRGQPPQETGRIDFPLTKISSAEKGWRMVVAKDGEGQEAITDYRVRGTSDTGLTWLELRLETGRTHQIRVHLAHRRYPLVGDPLYGGRLKQPAGATEALREALRGFRRQALHAFKLGLVHPASGEYMEFEAPLPEDFQTLIQVLEADREAQ